MANRINFDVGLNLNQAQYTQLKKQLNDLTKITSQNLLSFDAKLEVDNAKQNMEQIRKTANEVQIALAKAFNIKLNTVNVEKFSTALKNIGINRIYNDFKLAGAAGQSAFRNLTSQVLTTNLQLKDSHKLLDKIGTTLGNSMKWSAASSVVNRMAGTIESAWGYAKSLDTSLNNIRIVTGKSADEMARFAKTANQAAAKLGASTTDYTNAALIYYQQGLGDQEAQKRADVTVKTANVTGQSTATVSEQLTSVWNGYNITVEESEAAIDKLAAVAASTASDLEELSTGMSKVASAANIMGVDIDQLNAQLATIVSVTRQAPESVGTALKTIYARMGDIEAGLDGETSLDQYTEKMNEMGVNVLNAEGKLRDMGEVIEEVGNKWPEMSREQQVALSQIMAGTRQYNNLLSLFNNWDMYESALKTSKNSLGELEKQNQIYLESTKAHIQELDTAWERLFASLVDSKQVNGLIDIFTLLTKGMANFSESLGGGGNVLLAFGSIATQVFNKQISQSINTTVENFQKAKFNADQLKKSIDEINNLKQSQGYSDDVVKQMVNAKEQMSQYYAILDKNGINQGDAIIQEIGEVNNLADTWEQTKIEVDNYLQALAKSNGLLQGGLLDLDKDVDTSKYERMQGLLAKVTETIETSKHAWKDYNDEMKSATKDSEGLKDSLANVRVAAEQLTRRTGLSEALKVDLSEADEKLRLFIQDSQKWDKVVNTNFRTTTKEGREFAAIIETLRQKMTQAQEELATKTKQTSDVQKGEFNTLVTKTEEYKQGIDSAKSKWEEFIKPLQQTTVISNITQMVSSIGMISSSLMTLSNISKTLNNDQLSTGEKVLQITMALGTTIPMLVNSVGKMYASISALVKVVKNSIVTQALENAQLKYKNILVAAGAEEQWAAAFAEAAAKNAVKQHSKELVTEIALLTAKKALMAVGIIAAIGLVVRATYLLVKAYNEEADAAKRASETAEKARENYEEIKNINSELETSFNAYDTAIEKLEQCTKGTDDWKKALSEANDAARDVINTVQGLSGEDVKDLYKANEDGLLELNTDKVKEIQKNQARRESSAGYAADQADYDATMAQISSSLTDLARSVMPDTYGDRFVKGSAEGAIVGGKIAGPLGASVGAGIGVGLEQADWDNIVSDIKIKLNNNLDDFKNLPLEDFKNKLKGLDINIEHLSNTQVQNLQNSLEDLFASSENAKNKLEALALVNINNIIGNRDPSTSRMTKDDVDSQIRSKEREYENTIQNMSQAENWWATAKPEYDTILTKLNAAGYNYSVGKNIVIGSGDDRKLQFYDNDKKDYVEIPYKLVATQIATDEVNKQANDIANTYDNIFNDMSKIIGKDFTDNIKTYLENGSIEQFTKEQKEKILEGGSNSIFTYMRKVGINSDDIQKLAGHSKAGSDNFATKVEKSAQTSEEIANQYGEAVNNAFKNIDTSEASVASQRVISDILQNAFLTGGEDALKTTEAMIKSIPQNELDDFIKASKRVKDWGTITVDDLQKKLKDAGITTQFTAEQLQNYINAQRRIFQQAQTLDEVTKNYGEVNKIIKGLKIGDSISAEDYGKLNEAQKQYFRLTLDGTYQLIASAKELQKLTKENAINQLVGKSDDLVARYNKYKSVGYYDPDTLGKKFDISEKKYSDDWSINQSAQELREYLESLNKLEKTYDIIIDKEQKVFGNVSWDASNNHLLSLSSEKIESWRDQLNDYLSDDTLTNWTDNINEIVNLTSFDNFGKDNNIPIAFTPVFTNSQGEEVVLSKEEISNYLNKIIEEATDENGNLDTEKLLKLDSTNWTNEGESIHSIIADVGDTAQLTAEKMQYLGRYGLGGVLEDLSKNAENAIEIIKEVETDIGKTAELTTEHIQKQLNALNAIDYENKDQGQLDKWQDALSNGTLTEEEMQKIVDKYNEVKVNQEEWDKQIKETLKEWRNIQLTIANSATSLAELKEMREQGKVTDNNAYNDAAQNLWTKNREEDLDAEEIEDYARYIRDIAKDTTDFANSLSDGTKEAATSSRNLAIQIMRMNEAVDTLADNWEDWQDILKKSSKGSHEYYKALTQTREALADLLDIDEEYISKDLIEDNFNNITQAAKGSETAIDALRASALKKIILEMDFDEDSLINNSEKLTERVNNIQNLLNGMKLEVGASIATDGINAGEQELLDACNRMILDANMTKDQVNALFGAMGYDVTYAEEPQKVTQEVPIYETNHAIKLDGGLDIPDGNGGTKFVPGWKEYTETHQIGTKTYEGEVTASAMATSEPGTTVVPKINNIQKKATGSANNYSSKNSGGGSPGKKSGGSDKKPQKMDKVKDEPDRYHKVNTQLDKIDNNLKKIQSQEKKFIGTKLIDNLNGQLGQLDKRIDNLREKQKIAYGEADELRNKLAPQGVQFNDDGTIANYMEIYNSKLNYVNSLVDKYNSMSADEQEAFKETVEAAKEDYEQFKENLDRYDELVSDFIPGLTNDIQDAIDEEIELNIKKFNLEFEVRLEIADAQKDWNEFKRKILDDIDDDDILGNARARATDDLGVYLSGTDGKDGLLGAGVKQTQSILKELKDMDEKGWSNVYGDDRVSALEDLQEAYQNVEQSLMEIKEIQEDVAQAVLDQMDAVVDAMDKVADLMDTIDSQIEHDIKVIEMVYGETDYDAKGKYMEQRQKNNLDTLGTAKENRDYWEQQMNLIDDKTSEAYQKAQENFFKYNDAVNDAIEKSIEDAQEKAENAIDGIFKKYNDEITNGKGLDYTEQQWELVNDVADQYLDTVNAAFGIRQLEGKWKDAIDQTDNIGAQKKLNTLMEEQLKKLREKDKLTEYDIERAEKEYEIALKKLALEEAQQTKSTMRLRRDSQGNYRYEYVADENQIAKLQDELDALENSLYNFDKERWLEMQNQVVDAVRDRQDAIKEILMDASLTEEERLERLEEINKLYNEKIQNITDQAVTAQTNLYDSGATELAKIWDEQGKDFQNLSDEEQRILVEEMLPQFETGVNEMIDKFSGPGGFEDTTTGSMDALSQATQDYQNDLDDVENQAGITFDEIRNGQDDVLDRMPDMINDAEDYVEVMQDELSELQDINEELKKKLDYYKQIQIEAKKAATEAYNYWLKEQQIAAEKYAQENAKNNNNAGGNNGNTGNGNNNNNNKGHSGSSNRTLNQDTMNGIAGAIWIWGSDKSGWGTGETRWARLREKFGAGYDKQVQDYINSHQNSSNWKDWNSLKNYYYGSFDTGGYTGDWTGDYGKPILAHKKELILNADDTENMLDMLSITRDVVAAAGPRGPGSRLMIPQGETSALEQNVHIEATFPGVEDAAEIKQALNDLVNMAAQRANRNTRG